MEPTPIDIYTRGWTPPAPTYTLSDVARLFGEPQHRLIHLCEKGVVQPDHQDAEGRGSSRLFSARNVLEFAIALRLRAMNQLIAHARAVVYVLRRFEHEVQRQTSGFALPDGLRGDLKKKTLRGQMGQKERGFFVGERTYGYRSVPVGEMRMDKKCRPRPEGYRMEIEPREAATVLRIFKSYADGQSLTAIVKTLNEEGVRGFRSAKSWSAATVTRILGNEKYRGRSVWNKTTTRRDPRTGRRRKFEKPESEWVVRDDEALRIVPEELWEAVQTRRASMKKTWPGGKGKRGFSKDQNTSEKHFPTHLLSGTMSCAVCGASIAQVSGKLGGYYGCIAAAKRSCDNKLLVRRTLAERKVLDAVTERISDIEHIQYILERVEAVVAEMRSTLPEDLQLKEAELASERRRLENFLEFIAEGRGSKALAKAL